MLADMMTKPIAAVQFENIRDRLGIQGAAANESRGSFEKTAAVKKTPRQAASSVEASRRPSFDVPVGTGMYQ
uniref:SMP domain-containing protein n=1 Tax=Peronospora matthiolae TaxID=2874970 RepID=A0AAV1UAV1_9STRA